jgi:sugar diacid utilization regulator
MLMVRDLLQAEDIQGFDVDSVYDEFLQEIVNGNGYKGIANLLSQKLQVSVLIEDEYFFVQARAFLNTNTFSSKRRKKSGVRYWKPQYLDPNINEYVRALQTTLRPVVIPELPEYGIISARTVFPVVINNEVKKYLNVFKKDLSWEQMRIVRVALHSLKIMEICRHAQMEMEDQTMKSLVLGLISDKHKEDKIFGGNKILGFDLSREAVLAVVQIKEAPGQRQIEEALRSIIGDLYINASAIAVNNEQAVLLIQHPEEGALESSVVNESLHVIYEGLAVIFSGAKIRIGVGRQCYKPRDYKIAFEEACQALSSTSSKGENEEGVVYYHSLRLMGILLHPVNEQTLSVFVRLILGKLHDYSVNHSINLIDSVECYINHDCCIQSAARELFIHPNTLRYRLEKARKISGLDFTDNDTKLELQLAIKLYRYQGDLLWQV